MPEWWCEIAFKKRERAVAYMLRVLGSVGSAYGRELILADMPEEVYVPVIGRTLKRDTIKRYAEYVIRYCSERRLQPPVRKEYVEDKSRGKVLKLVVDPEACESLSGRLVSEMKLRAQQRRECVSELDSLRRKLKRCEEKTQRAEQVLEAVSDLVKYLDILLNILKIAGNRDELLRCVEELSERSECNIIIKLLDVATTAGDDERSAVDVFVDNYESDELYRDAVSEIRLDEHIEKLAELISKLKKAATG